MLTACYAHAQTLESSVTSHNGLIWYSNQPSGSDRYYRRLISRHTALPARRYYCEQVERYKRMIVKHILIIQMQTTMNDAQGDYG